MHDARGQNNDDRAEHHLHDEEVDLGDVEMTTASSTSERDDDRAGLMAADDGRRSRVAAAVERVRAFYAKHPRAVVGGVLAVITATVAAIVITWALAFAACQYTYTLPPTYTQPLAVPSYLNATFTGVTEFHVALLGDSLINYPYVHFNLPSLMSNMLPGLSVKWYNYGDDGDTIADINYRVGAVLSVLLPRLDAVILFWDSDVSDHSGATHADRKNLQTAFVTNLNATLTTIFVRCPTCFVAVAGPVLLGEGPLFPPRNVGPLYYWGKQRMLDKYRSLTREVCAASFVPYIDIRQAMEDALPTMSVGYSGCLTVDGEHENARGAAVVAKLFASALLLGLTGGASTGTDDNHIYMPSLNDDGGNNKDDSLGGLFFGD